MKKQPDFSTFSKQQHEDEILRIRYYLQCNLLGLMNRVLKSIDTEPISEKDRFEKERMEKSLSYLDYQYEKITGRKFNEEEVLKQILR